jgi:hypothetical protein
MPNFDKNSVGKVVYDERFQREMMPVFKEVARDLADIADRLFSTASCSDPKFETCDDVRRARDEVADEMIQIMEKWMAAG